MKASPKDFAISFPLTLQKRLPKEIIVISLSKPQSAALNRRYRKKRKPTNVLSFFYSPEYGEIILCPTVIRVEAKAAGNTYEYQMTWMVIHGMLHLSGIHHEASGKAEQQFERIEQAVLRKYQGLKT